jgi:hypothetical protein
MAAEQPGTAAKLEYVRLLELGQVLRKVIGLRRAGAQHEARSSPPARRSSPRRRRYDGRARANSRT